MEGPFRSISTTCRAVGERVRSRPARARVLCKGALQLYDQTGLVFERAEIPASLAAIVRDQGDTVDDAIAYGLDSTPAPL